MTQFETLSKPTALDFYTICEINNEKHVHVLGYCYERDTNDKSEKWGNIEFCSILVPLHEFINNLRSNDNYIDEIYCEVKQYQGDYSEEEMTEIINQYFDGHSAKCYLPYEELTEETPCGDYVR